ncbi:hypothetical protein PG993_012351 [Apiospora rasikravindrae]|uniref:Uncharacterized protein n=1 Tax=Apiospora rasikravindrae TaxID=990691 RepID=A0ABR1S262_9PEZI
MAQRGQFLGQGDETGPEAAGARLRACKKPGAVEKASEQDDCLDLLTDAENELSQNNITHTLLHEPKKRLRCLLQQGHEIPVRLITLCGEVLDLHLHITTKEQWHPEGEGILSDLLRAQLGLAEDIKGAESTT